CGVGPLPPEEAKRMKYKCPVCGKMLTKGVDDRVEELADMPNGHRPEGAQDFTHLLPLQELIALSMGIASEMNLNSKKIWSMYEKLVNFFGSEFKVLLEADIDDIAKRSDPEIAKLILRMRKGQIEILPGYDGVYGVLVLEDEKFESRRNYTRLEDYL
ncbi:MAG: endonuclease Q family protein, partial [Nitrososphaeria archaeon]|nr:endonuclease Q family protein [Nitrososphaeria archaeon]